LLSFSGLTFYGGLICAAVAISYYARKHKIGFWHLGDAIAPALMIAYAVGRIGCQVAGDGDWGILNSAYVTDPTTTRAVLADPSKFEATLQGNQVFYTEQFDSVGAVQHANVQAPSFLPKWMVAYTYPHNVINEGVRIPGCMDDHCSVLPIPVFPTPFYETVICTLFFFLLLALRKRIRTAGVIFGIYMILNGIERFTVEKIRVNTTYNFLGIHPTHAEIISLCLVIAGIIIVVMRRQRQKTIPA
jgi:phosphatidylglycerol---prolipoprotein diacylglyceryl transferase